MKIQYKLALVIFLFGSVFLTVVSTSFFFQSRRTILNEVKNSLLKISEDTAYDLSSRLIEKSKTHYPGLDVDCYKFKQTNRENHQFTILWAARW